MLFDAGLEEGRPPPPSGVPGDVARLEADFPAWQFAVHWITAGTRPDDRRLWAWPLEGGPVLTAPDEQAMRRAIGEAAN